MNAIIVKSFFSQHMVRSKISYPAYFFDAIFYLTLPLATFLLMSFSKLNNLIISSTIGACFTFIVIGLLLTVRRDFSKDSNGNAVQDESAVHVDFRYYIAVSAMFIILSATLHKIGF